MKNGDFGRSQKFSDLDDIAPPRTPDPQMSEKATRRRFSKAYKLDVIAKADLCTDRGMVGSLLRREGIFHSTLANFRKQRSQGLLSEIDARVGGGVSEKVRASRDPAVALALSQNSELERENRALRRKLAHAERIIAIQKKAAVLLGETLQDMNLGETD